MPQLLSTVSGGVELHRSLDRAATVLQEHVADANLPFSLTARITRQLAQPGRLLAPEGSAPMALLVLLAYQSAGGGAPAAAAPAAAAVECLLAAGDALDDLQDGDDQSVDNPVAAGQVAELISALLVLSQRTLLQMTEEVPWNRVHGAFQAFTDLELRALAGQRADLEASNRGSISVEGVLAISRRKSGSLGRCAAALGARLATDDPDIVDLHGEFGEHVGVVHQLMNDVAGVWPGGPLSTDIKARRFTPPVAFVLQIPRGTNPEADLVRAAFERFDSTDVDEQAVRWSILRSGAIHHTWGIAAIERLKAAHVAETILRHNPESRLGVLLLS